MPWAGHDLGAIRAGKAAANRPGFDIGQGVFNVRTKQGAQSARGVWSRAWKKRDSGGVVGAGCEAGQAASKRRVGVEDLGMAVVASDVFAVDSRKKTGRCVR